MPIDASATATEVAAIRRHGLARSPSSLPRRIGSAPEAATRRIRATYGDAALLKLTSGSTGFPKAILTAESHLIADGERIIRAMGIAASDTQLAVIPLSHSYGFGNLVMPLLLQGTAMVLRESFVPSQVLRRRSRISVSRVRRRAVHVQLPGGELAGRRLAAVFAVAHFCRRTAGCADGPQAFHDRFGIKIHSFYGASETGGIAYDASDASMADGQVGTAMPGVTISCGRTRKRQREAAGCSSAAILSRRAIPKTTKRAAFIDGGFLTGDFGFVDGRGHSR